MLELSIPQLKEESKSTKDLIFNILLEEKELSLIQIFNKIKKNYNVSITYQAIRKAVDLLVKQNIVLKQKKNYSLNKEYLLKIRIFIDKTLNLSENKQNISQFKPNLLKENYAIFTLNSLFELDNFWSDILVYLSKNLKEKEQKISVNLGHYAWWILINLGKETETFREITKRKVKTYFLLLKDNFINKKAKEIYEGINIKTKIRKRSFIPENLAIDTLGDTILQVEYPKEIIKEIKKYFEKNKEDNFNLKEITEIVHKPCKIRFVLFRNKEFAQTFNEKYLKYIKR